MPISPNGPIQYSGTAQLQNMSPTPDEIWGLTPEALLTYCQTQIRSIDDKIEAFMDGQKAMMKQKEILTNLKTKVEENCLVDKSDVLARATNIAQAYQDAYDALVDAGLPDAAEALAKEYQALFPNSDVKTGKIDTKDQKLNYAEESGWTAYLHTFDDAIDKLGKDMELNMIQLQSDMSKRQTAIQLTTNMLEKFNRGLDQVVGNIK